MNRSTIRRFGLMAGAFALTVAGVGAVAASQAGASPAPAGVAGVAGASGGAANNAAAGGSKAFTFRMVRSANAKAIDCLGAARATVTITPEGEVERMRIVADGLPANTEFDLFVTQVPNAPFGLSWYQGDLESDKHGHASQTYVGRFSEETFSVAPGVAPAPVVHDEPFPDAASNPQTAPVHQFHLGLWFNSPDDAAKAGCQATVTPFNGEHNAGVQAMSTRNFDDGDGPLRKVKP